MSITELDNPIWHSLTHQHARFAIGNDLAQRYPPEVFRFAATSANTQTAFKALEDLIAKDEIYIISRYADLDTEQWNINHHFSVLQMIYSKPISKPDIGFQALSKKDNLHMTTLAELTNLEYFERTTELGPYIGIWQDDKLVAMAGSRMFTPHYREISTVCTHPDYRGKGYGGLLTRALAYQFQQENITPFLQVLTNNVAAKRLYERLGFEIHQQKDYSVICRR